MQLRKLTAAVLTALLLIDVAAAQDSAWRARSRSTRPATVQATQRHGSAVSGDLLDIYAKTKAATTEAAATAIARSCAEVVPDESRSQVDREYAASLLAWALNRRGELRNDRAAKLVEQGQFEEANQLDRKAADDFETAIKYGPTNWRTHHNFAISLSMEGNYADAIDMFTQAIELKPDYANAYFNRGELHFELEQYRQAVDDYGRAIELDSQDPQYFNSRGHSKFMLQSYVGAVADYEKACALGSDSAVYQTDLADAYQFLGRWEDAATAYRAAIAINNQYARAYQNAAWLMSTCPEEKYRNTKLALSAAKKALEFSNETSARSLDTLAAALAASGKHSDAARTQQRAIAMAADAEERAELAERLGLYERGIAYRQTRTMSTIAGGLQPTESASIRTASGSRTNRNTPR